ncbi:MAG: hypothetical protein JXR37_13020 [Kiritimatiellae bacterium]|nr:hypothetical protein [Kiritimatiellia bacterium]
MTSRERVTAAMAHEPIDRTPLRFNPRKEVVERMRAYFGDSDVERCLGADFRHVAIPWLVEDPPAAYIPPNAPPRPAVTSRETAGGIVNQFSVYFPFANLRSVGELAPVEAHLNGTLALRGAGDLAQRIDRINGEQRYFISLKGVPGLFTSSSQQRGPEQFLMDFALNAEFVHRWLEIKTVYSVALYDKVLADIRGKVDCVHYGDDLGTQQSTFISPAMMREFLFPRYKRIFDVVHSHGVRVFMHCCGAIHAIIPDLIETGVDILNPIQLGASGMDAAELKASFGERVTFCGGVDVQTTLPFGSVADVADEVRFLVDTLGRDGGYIIDSSNIIQPDTPAENVDAMFRTGREYALWRARVAVA